MRSKPPRKILELLYKIFLNAAFISGTKGDTLIKYVQLFYRIESKGMKSFTLKWNFNGAKRNFVTEHPLNCIPLCRATFYKLVGFY